MVAGRMTRVVRGNQSRGKGLNFKQVKQVQKIVNSNKKLKQDYNSINDTIITTGVLSEFTAIAEGEDWNSRDTDKILLQSIKCQLCFAQNGTPASQQIRVMVVRGKYGPLTLGVMPGLLGEPNLDKMQVYFDRIFRTSDADFDPIFWDIYKKFSRGKIPHMVVNYDDGVSATAAQNNPVYLYYIGNQATLGATVNGTQKTKFFDAN